MNTEPALNRAVPALQAATNVEALRHVVKQCRLFRGLSETELDSVIGSLQLCEGREGTVLLTQDRPGDGLYIVYSGRVKVVMYGPQAREVTLAILRPGEVFGELAMLDGAPRSATVVAMSDAQLLALPREDFMRHLHRNPQTAFNLLAELARRLRRADETIVGLALQDVEVRLVRTLARLRLELELRPDLALEVIAQPSPDLRGRRKSPEAAGSKKIGQLLRPVPSEKTRARPAQTLETARPSA